LHVTARRVAVLGGIGFVGHHVLAAFEQRVHACVPASRREGVDLRNPAQRAHFLQPCAQALSSNAPPRSKTCHRVGLPYAAKCSLSDRPNK
jgi:nucleoside-diphosphate-sugar epimerase